MNLIVLNVDWYRCFSGDFNIMNSFVGVIGIFKMIKDKGWFFFVLYDSW